PPPHRFPYTTLFRSRLSCPGRVPPDIPHASNAGRRRIGRLCTRGDGAPRSRENARDTGRRRLPVATPPRFLRLARPKGAARWARLEEHTSELQSRVD